MKNYVKIGDVSIISVINSLSNSLTCTELPTKDKTIKTTQNYKNMTI